ncbi:MAG: DUF1634 domain-containing protein [Deltaproteobacteria bacterium]|nr:DUF1634 domain-containing protein [Deltaproteobacteria bacterium]
MDNKQIPEQITYANILFFGAWIGIFIMILTYVVYATGLITPHVDIMLIIQNWDKGVDEYMHITNSPRGWEWLTLLDKSDYLNFVGLVLIALLTIVCYLFLMVGYKKKKDWIYFFICLFEIIVLAFAASGILDAGGH